MLIQNCRVVGRSKSCRGRIHNLSSTYAEIVNSSRIQLWYVDFLFKIILFLFKTFSQRRVDGNQSKIISHSNFEKFEFHWFGNHERLRKFATEFGKSNPTKIVLGRFNTSSMYYLIAHGYDFWLSIFLTYNGNKIPLWWKTFWHWNPPIRCLVVNSRLNSFCAK